MNAQEFKSAVLKLIDDELKLIDGKLTAQARTKPDPEDEAYVHGRKDALRSLHTEVFFFH